MRYVLLAGLLVSRLIPCVAQTVEPQLTPESYVVPSVWRLDILGIGVIHELRLGPKTTLNSGLHLGTAITTVTTNTGTGRAANTAWSYQLFPEVYTGVRYFYNFERRIEKGKSVRYNSGNYLSGKVIAQLPPFAERYDAGPIDRQTNVGFQALWGFQRTYRRNFYLNLGLGLGFYGNPKQVAPVTTAGDFTIGYTFSNKRGNGDQ